MPSDDKKRLYWDADVFLSYINSETGRVDIIAELLAHSRAGEIVILTSTISLTEVAFSAMEKAGTVLDPATEKAIDELWSDRDAVTLIEVSELVNKGARDLMRAGMPNGWRLRPMDAIHLASAQLHNADELHTYNLDDFKKYEALTGFKIENPYLIQGVLGFIKNQQV